MAAWIESDSLFPMRPKPQDLVMCLHVATRVSSVQDEAPIVLNGGPWTVQSLEQVPGNSCCDASVHLPLKDVNSYTGWTVFLKL